MLDNIATMFDDMKSMMKHLKKKNYETNMDQFLKKYGSYFAEMTQHLEATEQKDVAVKELANCFVSAVEKRFATGKKNRIPSYSCSEPYRAVSAASRPQEYPADVPESGSQRSYQRPYSGRTWSSCPL